jgi:hypothetical protein
MRTWPRRFAAAVWDWAGRAADYGGRFLVLVYVGAVIVGGVLVLLRGLGLVDTVLATIGGSAILLGGFFLIAYVANACEASTKRGQSDQRESEPAFLGATYSQQVVWLPIDPSENLGWFFCLYNVVVTNRSPNRISLMPSLVLELRDGNTVELDQKGPLLVPAEYGNNHDSLLQGPLDLDPGRSLRGHLGFTLIAPTEKLFFGEDGFQEQLARSPIGPPVCYVVWRDHVTEKEIAHEVTHPLITPQSEPLTLDELLSRRRQKELH